MHRPTFRHQDLDLNRVSGTGFRGRISISDVLRAYLGGDSIEPSGSDPDREATQSELVTAAIDKRGLDPFDFLEAIYATTRMVSNQKRREEANSTVDADSLARLYADKWGIDLSRCAATGQGGLVTLVGVYAERYGINLEDIAGTGPSSMPIIPRDVLHAAVIKFNVDPAEVTALNVEGNPKPGSVDENKLARLAPYKRKWTLGPMP